MKTDAELQEIKEKNAWGPQRPDVRELVESHLAANEVIRQMNLLLNRLVTVLSADHGKDKPEKDQCVLCEFVIAASDYLTKPTTK